MIKWSTERLQDKLSSWSWHIFLFRLPFVVMVIEAILSLYIYKICIQKREENMLKKRDSNEKCLTIWSVCVFLNSEITDFVSRQLKRIDWFNWNFNHYLKNNLFNHRLEPQYQCNEMHNLLCHNRNWFFFFFGELKDEMHNNWKQFKIKGIRNKIMH